LRPPGARDMRSHGVGPGSLTAANDATIDPSSAIVGGWRSLQGRSPPGCAHPGSKGSLEVKHRKPNDDEFLT
jgi:hypothetical protein